MSWDVVKPKQNSNAKLVFELVTINKIIHELESKMNHLKKKKKTWVQIFWWNNYSDFTFVWIDAIDLVDASNLIDSIAKSHQSRCAVCNELILVVCWFLTWQVEINPKLVYSFFLLLLFWWGSSYMLEVNSLPNLCLFDLQDI